MEISCESTMIGRLPADVGIGSKETEVTPSFWMRYRRLDADGPTAAISDYCPPLRYTRAEDNQVN